MGIDINLTPEEAQEYIESVKFSFLFAPHFHPAMKHCAVPRRELGIKTIMNLLGPLANPAEASHQLIGVFSKKYLKIMAHAADMVGIKRAVIVHGHDGMDEISVSGPTWIAEKKGDGSVQEYEFDPGELDIPYFPREKLKGGDAQENIVIAKELISGRGEEAVRHAVLLNTGGALFAAETAGSIKEGYLMAADALDSGRVQQKIEQIIDFGKLLARRRAS
jgi:anthranilate synthase/phosphoribosyltransferase